MEQTGQQPQKSQNGGRFVNLDTGEIAAKPSPEFTQTTGSPQYYTEQQKHKIMVAKDLGLAFIETIERLTQSGVNSRELVIAAAKVEESVLWAVKAAAR